MRPDMYFSVDVEADGPIPGPFSMLSFGVAVAGIQTAAHPDDPAGPAPFQPVDPTATTFYRELRPISADFDPAALAVSGLDRAALLASGAEPAVALAEFDAWVRATAGEARPVVVGYPVCYDWMFLYWYLIRFVGTSVFGHSGCFDLKTLYAARAGVPLSGAVKARMPRHLLSRRPHTHHALDDAIEQAELCANLMTWSGRDRPVAGS